MRQTPRFGTRLASYPEGGPTVRPHPLIAWDVQVRPHVCSLNGVPQRRASRCPTAKEVSRMPNEHALRYRVRPLSPELADEVRMSLRSPDYGHPVHAETADGPGPCRVCLEKFRPGEDRRLLFTYDPFRTVAPGKPLPGPIFIHEHWCTPWHGGDLPRALADDRLTLLAYGDDRRLLDEVRTSSAGEVLDVLEIFALQQAEYVHVRSTPAGCFLFQLARMPG